MDASIIEKRSVYYTTILSHTITSDGKYLIGAQKTGKLTLFAIEDILKHNIDAEEQQKVDEESVRKVRKPKQNVSTSTPVYSLALINENHLVCGGKGLCEI